MGTKRSHDEVEAVHSDRRTQIYGLDPKPVKRPRKSGPVEPRKQVHDSSVNTIKKRIRDVRRRLERAKDLPANIRVEDERALAAFQQELLVAEEEGVRQKMIKKYHMVRFVERKKATRSIKKLRKRLLEAQSTDEVDTIKALLHVAEVDLSYTQYCPLAEVYIGLYSKSADEEVEDDAENGIERKKPEIWSEVEKRMEEGGLDELRNRRQYALASRPKPQKKVDQKPSINLPAVRERRRTEHTTEEVKLNRSERRSKVPSAKRKEVAHEPDKEENAHMSDGGFFEE